MVKIAEFRMGRRIRLLVTLTSRTMQDEGKENLVVYRQRTNLKMSQYPRYQFRLSTEN